MYTRCPECATTFRLTPAQLRVAHGKVRCGQCSTVFDALSHLVEDNEARHARATNMDEAETRVPDSSPLPGPETQAGAAEAAASGAAADSVAEVAVQPHVASDAATDMETSSGTIAQPQTLPAGETAEPSTASPASLGSTDPHTYYDFTEPTGGFDVTELTGEESLWFDSAEAEAEHRDEPGVPGSSAEFTVSTDELEAAELADEFEVKELPGDEALWLESAEAEAQSRDEARDLGSSVDATESTDEFEVRELPGEEALWLESGEAETQSRDEARDLGSSVGATESTDEFEVAELADAFEVAELTGEEDLWFGAGEDLRDEERVPGASEAEAESPNEPPTVPADEPAPRHAHPQPTEDSASPLAPLTRVTPQTAASDLAHAEQSADVELTEPASDFEITELPTDERLWTEQDTPQPPAGQEQATPPPGEHARDIAFSPAAEEAATRAAPETASSDFEVMELPTATPLPDDEGANETAVPAGEQAPPTGIEPSASGLTILSGLDDTGSAPLEVMAEEPDAEDAYRDTRDLDEELLESSGILEAPRYPAPPAAPSTMRGTREAVSGPPSGPDSAAPPESSEVEADAADSEDPWDGLFFDDDHGIPDLEGIAPAREDAAARGTPEPPTAQPRADEPGRRDAQQVSGPAAEAKPPRPEETSAATREAPQPTAGEPGPPAEAGPASDQQTQPRATAGPETNTSAPPAQAGPPGSAVPPTSSGVEPQTDIPEHVLAALRAARAIDARKSRAPGAQGQVGKIPVTPDAGAEPQEGDATAGKAAEQPGAVGSRRDARGPTTQLLEDILRENASQEPGDAETPVRTPAKPTTGAPDTVEVDEGAWDELAAQLGLGDGDRPAAGSKERVSASAHATAPGAQPRNRAAVAAPDESSALLAELEDALRENAMLPDDGAAALPRPTGAEIVSPPLATDRPRRRRWLTIASLALALLLVGQIIHANRLALVDHPVLGSALRGIYGGLGRDLPADWELASYDLRQLGGAVSPDDPQTIIIRVSLRNSANRPQPYPRIRLHLEDRWGERVGQRDLLPSEYAAVGPDQMLAPGQHILADIAVQDPPGVEATNFQIDACLELLPGRLSCANENAN